VRSTPVLSVRARRFTREPGEVAVTYDNSESHGVGSQLQRIYGLYALSRALDVKYVRGGAVPRARVGHRASCAPSSLPTLRLNRPRSVGLPGAARDQPVPELSGHGSFARLRPPAPRRQQRATAQTNAFVCCPTVTTCVPAVPWRRRFASKQPHSLCGCIRRCPTPVHPPPGQSGIVLPVGPAGAVDPAAHRGALAPPGGLARGRRPASPRSEPQPYFLSTIDLQRVLGAKMGR
jgi:hypothetical protein